MYVNTVLLTILVLISLITIVKYIKTFFTIFKALKHKDINMSMKEYEGKIKNMDKLYTQITLLSDLIFKEKVTEPYIGIALTDKEYKLGLKKIFKPMNISVLYHGNSERILCLNLDYDQTMETIVEHLNKLEMIGENTHGNDTKDNTEDNRNT